jgi:C4-dicarboxylate-specific signal transduction histidine kinase
MSASFPVPGPQSVPLRAAASHKRRHEIIAVGVMAILVILVTTVAAAYTLREVNRRNWVDEMNSISLLLAEHASQTMFSANTVLSTLADSVDKLQLRDDAAYRAYASAEAQFTTLVDTTKGNPLIDVATFVARDGAVLNFTRSFPAPVINLSERDYFKAHRDNPAIEVFTSVPVRNKGNGKWVFYLSRRVDDPQGRMLGLVLVGVSVEVFAKLYESVSGQLGRGASINLYRNDFTLMTRWPLVDAMVGQVNRTGVTFDVIANQQLSSGTRFTDQPTVWRKDAGVDRLVATRRVEGYPFIVTPVVTEDSYMQNWWVSVRWLGLSCLLSMGLVVVGMGMLLKSARRSERELEQRLKIEALLRAAQGDLESRVAARTADLRREIIEREQAQQELARVNTHIATISHRAGMAEVANSVLHNVGNVLNSVNVSATVLAEQVRRTPMADFPRAVALLSPPQGDPAESPAGGTEGREVVAFLGLLAGQWESEQLLMLHETAQLRHQVEHIRDIVSRQQSLSGQSGLTERFKPSDVIHDALAIHQEALQRNAITVEADDLDTGEWHGDRGKLTQILLNLVVNAEQSLSASNAAERRIVCRCAIAADASLNISVADNGLGIAPAVLAQLFTYGFTTKSKGHGLGLHASALAAQEMVGGLRAASDGLGQGAVFTLSLPAADVERQNPSTRSDA